MASRAHSKRLVGYGLGDFGLNIYWHSLSLILVFWYAEVVGLEPQLAGWIYALGLLWDAISDPLVASFAAANRSRHGVYRPFILYGSIALGASFCLLFWRPPLEGTALFLALLAAAIVFRTCYTIVAVPYAALSSRLTFDSTERSDLAGVRMMFAFGGMLCVTTFFFPLSRWFADGLEHSPEGFLKAASLGAILATAVLISCFFLTSEKEPLGKQSKTRRVSMRAFLEALRMNAALRILLVVLLINSAAGAALLIPMTFYLEAKGTVLAEKELTLTIFALATLLSTPLWTIFARIFGKKKCWYVATALMVAVGCHLFFFGPLITYGVPLQIILMGFGNSAFAVVTWALVPDTVEYGQFTYGERDEGPVFGSSLFAQKAAGALSGLAIGYVLAGLGYDPNLAEQEAETGAGIGAFIALVPPLLLVAAAIVLSFMPLNRDLHTRIVDELSG
jgi:GPH family glycoside/pentoside/hexuronide:cation symporter